MFITCVRCNHAVANHNNFGTHVKGKCSTRLLEQATRTQTYSFTSTGVPTPPMAPGVMTGGAGMMPLAQAPPAALQAPPPSLPCSPLATDPTSMHVDGDDGAWHEGEYDLGWEGDEWIMDVEGPGPAMATPITPLAGLASSSEASSCPAGAALEGEMMEGEEEQEEGLEEGRDEWEGFDPGLRPHIARDDNGICIALREPECLRMLGMVYHQEFHCVVCFRCKGGAVISITAKDAKDADAISRAIWGHAYDHFKFGSDGCGHIRKMNKAGLVAWARDHCCELQEYYSQVGPVHSHFMTWAHSR